VFGWDIEGDLRAGDYNFVYGKYFNHQLGTVKFVHHRLLSAFESRVC